MRNSRLTRRLGLVALGATIPALLSLGLATIASADKPLLPVGGGTEAADSGKEKGFTVANTAGGKVDPASLAEGQFLVGAHKVNIAPRPEAYGGTWETDQAKCETLSPSAFSAIGENPEHGAHLATATKSPWPENPNCIYMGGYGIGPMNAIERYDEEFGLWVRSVAVQNKAGKGFVLTVIDGEGYWWDYVTKCSDCGVKQLSQELSSKLGIQPSGIVITATHAHTSPDFIGGWGFVPDWYMTQVAEAIRESVTTAWDNRSPAVLEVGEEMARAMNSERRGTYRSAEEQQVAWFRAFTPGQTDEAIATVGAFAAHPVTKDEEGGVGHADWMATWNKRSEERFGGIGLMFNTGLGNITGANPNTGAALADLLPEIGHGRIVEGDTSIQTAETIWDHPVTNAPLSALGLPGFFDRRFNPIPAEVRTGKVDNPAGIPPCVSSAAVSVQVVVRGIRIGKDLAITTGPGELFSNVTNTIKEKGARDHGYTVTMPLAQANDALGYLPQSFEMNPVNQQGPGFVLGGVLVVNYEDAYAIDRCFGDKVLEESIAMLGTIKQP